MDDLIISVRVIGSVAGKSLLETTHGLVIGAPSGGFFLRTESGQVLFLSRLSWHGPLTINLPQSGDHTFSFDLHAPFVIQSGSMYFPDRHLTIQFSQAEHWFPPPRPAELFPQDQRIQIFARVLAQVSAGLTKRSGTAQISGSDLRAQSGSDSDRLETLRIAVGSGEPASVLAALIDGLGRGPGLTPAGDDLAFGFLLALNRWGDRLLPNLLPESINRALVEASRQHTTALSASLMECAAAGQADERLVAALDGLVTGNLAEDRIVEYLLGWGHTSGAAALQGMGLVVNNISEIRPTGCVNKPLNVQT